MFILDANIGAATSTLRISGEVTIDRAAEIFFELRKLVESGAVWEVDASEISSIDAAGIQVLLAAKRLAMQCGGDFRLIRRSRAVTDILEITHLGARFA